MSRVTLGKRDDMILDSIHRWWWRGILGAMSAHGQAGRFDIKAPVLKSRPRAVFATPRPFCLLADHTEEVKAHDDSVF